MKKMQLELFDGVKITVIPNLSYEFLMPTEDVAHGYGVSAITVRRHKQLNSDELIEGKHFLTSTKPTNSSSVQKSNARNNSSNLETKQVFWTKAGIIRLGFFIKSQQAKAFRNWAENLILAVGAKAAQTTQAAAETLHYVPNNNRQLGQDFAMCAYREILNIESSRTRKRLADLVEYYVSQIQ